MKKLTLLFILIVTFVQTSYALDIVYPKKQKLTINAQSTFFVGNTKQGSNLTINNKPVKLWDEGGFVHVVPLTYGTNIIRIKSIKNKKKEEITYKITRNKLATNTNIKKEPFIAKKENTALYTKTKNENSTIRENSNQKSQRIIDINENIVLYLSGKQGEYYKIEEKGTTNFWIHESNVEKPVTLTKRIPAIITKREDYSDNLFEYTKIKISHPVLYTIKNENNIITTTLYGAKEKDKNQTEDNYTFSHVHTAPVLGYEGYYENGYFILKRAKLPNIISTEKPLKGIKIFVDAGHGGSAKGAVGPTRKNEKDINLSICKKLINLLQEDGAIVSYSRIDDTNPDLYERVKIAKQNEALISLSIHNNSLPNGKDPYIQHGTEVHYYNDNAKELGEIIKNNLVRDLNLKDNGLKKSSFALNRSTYPISLLVEVAYMINPPEYKLLQNDKFQTNVAKSIKKSLEEYIISLK